MSQGMSAVKLQEWLERFERFKKSGQSVKRFCEMEQISDGSFYTWRKRISALDDPVGTPPRKTSDMRKGNAQQAASRVSPSNGQRDFARNTAGFQSVQISPVTAAAQRTIVRLAGGSEIELGSDLQVVESIVKLLLDADVAEGR